MKNIYLVRHGESEANIDKAVYHRVADHAVSLSARGVRQAHLAGAKLRDLIDLPPDAALRVWCSPYHRTRQTAQALCAELGKRYPKLDRREHINLCEQQFGLFDGVDDADLPRLFPREHEHYKRCEDHEGRFWARMPLGESRFDVAVRVHEAFGTFHRDAERHGIENIVVVCHGVTLRAFVMQWLHLPVEWFEKAKNPGNCSIYHLPESGEGGYVCTGGLE